MNEITREALFNQVRAWTLEASALIREKIHLPLTIHTKSNPNDLVTQLDREVEFFFASKIKTHYPEHLLLSEEGYGDTFQTKQGTIWIIDPIDGTMNFVHQKKNFAISIGIYHEGIGEIGIIFDVMNNHLYSAVRDGGAYKNDRRLDPLKPDVGLSEAIICLNHHWLTPNRLVDEKVMHQLIKDVRGTRTYGSAALEFAHVAEGSADGYITMGLEPWDVAGGRVLINEVGGVLTDVFGKPVDMLERSSILVCNAALQSALLDNYLIKAAK